MMKTLLLIVAFVLSPLFVAFNLNDMPYIVAFTLSTAPLFVAFRLAYTEFLVA